MWKIMLLVNCALWGIANAEPSHENMEKPAVGSYSNSYAGSYGDDGDYTGNNNYNDDYGYPPYFGFGAGIVDPYLFHQQLTNQILANNEAHRKAIASTISQGGARVTASASSLPNDFPDFNSFIQRQQADLANNFRSHGHYNHNTGSNRYAPNYAAAAASIGPKGGHQTAFISPENPDMPNISNRFSPSSPNGFKSVFVSSSSSSSNVDGKETNHRRAQTIINDNGLITSYETKS